MAPSTRSTKRKASEAKELTDTICKEREPILPKPRNAPLMFPLPKKGEVDPWFGLTRGSWNELLLPTVRNEFSPPVRSIVDRSRASERKDGKAARCKRLVIFESALKHFNRIAQESEQAKCA